MKATYTILTMLVILLLAVGTVSAAGNPSCDFTATPVNGAEDLTVTFTGTTENMSPLFSYHWDFGDNSGAEKSSVSTISSISHTYLNPGQYTVRLAVYDIGVPTTWWVSNTKTDYITVTNVTPVADFTFVESPAPEGIPTVTPTSFQFTDTSVGVVQSRLWDFGDGTQSTVENPLHDYPAVDIATTYLVTFTVTNDGGYDSITKSVSVLPPKPHAQVSVDSDRIGKAPLAVQFKDASTGVGINSWLWTFGDGQTSILQNPLHAYSSVGIYEVSLEVTSPSGTNKDTAKNYITVTNTSPDVCPPVDVCPTPMLCPPPVITPPPRDTIGIYSNGMWYLDDGDMKSNSPDRVFAFGKSGWLPVTGDWDGNGRREIGVSKDGIWYLDYNGDGLFGASDKYYGFGAAGWTPVVGDWDMNGIDEIGVFKEGNWYLDLNGNGAWDTGIDGYYGYGAAGWNPVVEHW